MIQTPGAPFSPQYEDNSGLSNSSITLKKVGLLDGDIFIPNNLNNTTYANLIVNESNSNQLNLKANVPIFENQKIQFTIWNNTINQIALNFSTGFVPVLSFLAANRMIFYNWKSIKKPDGSIVFYYEYSNTIIP